MSKRTNQPDWDCGWSLWPDLCNLLFVVCLTQMLCLVLKVSFVCFYQGCWYTLIELLITYPFAFLIFFSPGISCLFIFHFLSCICTECRKNQLLHHCPGLFSQLINLNSDNEDSRRFYLLVLCLWIDVLFRALKYHPLLYIYSAYLPPESIYVESILI